MRWLLKIAENREITIRLGYLMRFGLEPFTLEILNLKTVLHSQADLVREVLINRLI